VDPAADLALLGRARRSVDVDQALDFGPAWYAPLLALMVAGLSLAGPGEGAVQVGGWVVGVSAAVLVAGHDQRRRRIRGRRSIRSAAFVLGQVICCWAIIAAWGTAISSMGVDDFVPWPALGAWAATTVVFLAIRALLVRVRRRRPALR